MNEPAIEVADISKRFRVYRDKPTSLKQRVLSSRRKAEDFWALRDVALDVGEGSTFGLIGHNGSGKTTLLKCVAGILRPTSGTIRQRGRLAALLELGAGFHPELTGRENVYLNASFLGLSRKQTDAAFDDIVAFAELETFIDNEVKFYSSGMLVRLGFAVAVHVDPDVLLIDEVLAVGDEAFQAKCLDRIRAFQRQGRTIVLVTHALDTVIEICDRAAMLHHGELHAIGMPADVVREMRYVLLGVTDPNFVPEEGTHEAEIAEVQIVRPNGSSEGAILRGDPLTILIDVRQHEPVDDLDVDFAVLDGATNHAVLDARTSRAGLDLGRFEKKRVRFRIDAFPYEPGKYWVTVGLSDRTTGHLYHVQTQRYLFEVVDAPRVQERVEVSVAVGVEDL
ncbi:MAG TPA: ABC transporter ATP-binding protein [Actinomycetota bacterium]|nr:ABC transporter ATP-binding protein [Actinomycetota bacterium]